MLLAEYEAIIARHNQLPLRTSLDVLVKEFAHVPGHVLRSIINTYFVRWNKASYYRQYKLSRNSDRPGFVLAMADKLKTSPALLCRLLIESYLVENGEASGKKQVNMLLKDSSFIRDEVLAFEVFYCVIQDPFYGPFTDAKKGVGGQKYEIALKDFLRQKAIAFLDENDLREQGYDKTVDVKLAVPAVINGDMIIMWIESKSAFGDVKTHEEYAREQYHSYLNRFGPGLIIYWCGFIDELRDSPENFAGSSRIYLTEQPPEDICSMVDLV